MYSALNNICHSLLVSYFRNLSSLIQTATCYRDFQSRSLYFTFGSCNEPLPLPELQCGCVHNFMKCQYRILSRFISNCSYCTKCCLQRLYSDLFLYIFIILTARHMYSARVKYLRKNANTLNQYISYF
jgi:hypothetical protein